VYSKCIFLNHAAFRATKITTITRNALVKKDEEKYNTTGSKDVMKITRKQLRVLYKITRLDCYSGIYKSGHSGHSGQ